MVFDLFWSFLSQNDGFLMKVLIFEEDLASKVAGVTFLGHNRPKDHDSGLELKRKWLSGMVFDEKWAFLSQNDGFLMKILIVEEGLASKVARVIFLGHNRPKDHDSGLEI